MKDMLRRSKYRVKRLLTIFLVSIGLCLLYGLKVRQAVADDIYILSMEDGGRFFHASDLSCVTGRFL